MRVNKREAQKKDCKKKDECNPFPEKGDKVKYTKLGNSDLNVSRICMGCMGFGDSGTGQESDQVSID